MLQALVFPTRNPYRWDWIPATENKKGYCPFCEIELIYKPPCTVFRSGDDSDAIDRCKHWSHKPNTGCLFGSKNQTAKFKKASEFYFIGLLPIITGKEGYRPFNNIMGFYEVKTKAAFIIDHGKDIDQDRIDEALKKFEKINIFTIDGGLNLSIKSSNYATFSMRVGDFDVFKSNVSRFHVAPKYTSFTDDKPSLYSTFYFNRIYARDVTETKPRHQLSGSGQIVSPRIEGENYLKYCNAQKLTDVINS